MRYLPAFLFVALLAVPSAGTAEPVPPAVAAALSRLERRVEELSARVQAQDREIEGLRRRNAAMQDGAALPPPERPSAPDVPSTVPIAPSSASASVSANSFNPEIGLVADVVATSTESSEDEHGNDRVSLRELELVFGSDVDPYSRFDATLAFSDEEEVHVDEAYLTHLGLPYDTQARLGVIRPRIGRTAYLHRDALDTVDEPLVIARYLGDHGYARSGLELANYLPFPWDSPAHELVFGLVEGGTGEGGTAFGDTRRYPVVYGRLRHSFELADNDLLEGATTAMSGTSDEDGNDRVWLFGADVAHIHYLDPVRRVKLQAEAWFQSREGGLEEGEDHSDGHGHEDVVEVDEEHPAEDIPFRRSPWGVYALADLRLSQSWALGTRWDRVEPVNETIRRADQAVSAYLTFFQSEFARWRFQYQHLDEASGGEDDRVFLQGTFAIGVHRHALQ